MSPSGTGFSNSLGGGLDFRLAKPIGWSVPSDYLQT